MELIAKISKGTRMDQIYLPKNRAGLSSGSYVLITPLQEKKSVERPIFYGLEKLEPIKVEIIKKLFSIVDSLIEKYENVMITGSFLDEGFHFNDVDILIITEKKTNDSLAKEIKLQIGINPHIISLDNNALIQGLSTDPLYQTMISKCVAKKRAIYNIEPKINYKLLDLHLLKSKTLIENFDVFNGKEKYYLTMNLISIKLFLTRKKVTKQKVNKKIEEFFEIKIGELKQNLIEKKSFLNKYKELYKRTFNQIMKEIKHESKQEKIN